MKARATVGVVTFLLIIAMSTEMAAQQILFKQIGAAPEVNSNQFVDIPGLGFQLPAASATQNVALIILDVPKPYATGTDFPGIDFAIRVNATVVADGAFTYPDKAPASFARVPITLVVAVPLTKQPQWVTAQWRSVRSSIGRIDSFSSLSAVIGKK